MNDKPKSKWYWRLLRWGLIGLAVLATLVAILVTEEDWRGKRDWEAYKHAAEARGEHFDWSALMPANVPDDQNFYAAPIVAQALKLEHVQTTGPSQQRDADSVNRMNFNIYRGEIGKEIDQGGNWHKGTLTDLKQWQTAFRNFRATPEGKTNGFPIAPQPQMPAADILLALSVYDPALEELRQASRRPYMRLPLDYEKGFEAVGDLLPWLADEKRCAQFLRLRILAELNNGQSQGALDDLKLLLRLTDAIRNPPFLISHLVRMAIQTVALQPIYEGLAQHGWNDYQLGELEAALATEDQLADFQLAMRGELTCTIDSLEAQRLTREMKSVAGEGSSAVTITNSLRWMPSAFFYQNELAFARMYEQYILPVVDLTNRTVSVAACNTSEAEMQKQLKHYSPYTIQALMVFPAVGQSVKKFAVIQSDLDLARVACALERYRLAHAEYPTTLDALAPQFIEQVPHDIINGQPLHYRLTNDTSSPSGGAAGDSFVLYSVGWNEKDDGGAVVFDKYGRVDRDQGDWVWR